jgi:hypothetical protein
MTGQLLFHRLNDLKAAATAAREEAKAEARQSYDFPFFFHRTTCLATCKKSGEQCSPVSKPTPRNGTGPGKKFSTPSLKSKPITPKSLKSISAAATTEPTPSKAATTTTNRGAVAGESWFGPERRNPIQRKNRGCYDNRCRCFALCVLPQVDATESTSLRTLVLASGRLSHELQALRWYRDLRKV